MNGDNDSDDVINKQIQNAPQFNFDEMAALYQSDPTAFDKQAATLLEDTIVYWTDDLDQQQRLRGMVNRVHMESHNIKEPLVRATKSFNSMMEVVYLFQQTLNGNLPKQQIPENNVVKLNNTEPLDVHD